MSVYSMERIEYPLTTLCERIAAMRGGQDVARLLSWLETLAMERAMGGLPEQVQITRAMQDEVEGGAPFALVAAGLYAMLDPERQAEVRMTREHSAALFEQLAHDTRFNPVAVFNLNAVRTFGTPVTFQPGPVSIDDPKVMGVYDPVRGIILDDEVDDGELAEHLVHEARHSWQRHEVVATLNRGGVVEGRKQTQADMVEDYVSSKLAELDAWNTARAYAAWERDDAAGEDRCDDLDAGAARFLRRTMAEIDLSLYERDFIADLIPLIEGGGFTASVRASRLLAKPFLKQLLIRPDGGRYAPAALNGLCDAVVAFVATPHHPDLVAALHAASDEPQRPLPRRAAALQATAMASLCRR